MSNSNTQPDEGYSHAGYYAFNRGEEVDGTGGTFCRGV